MRDRAFTRHLPHTAARRWPLARTAALGTLLSLAVAACSPDKLLKADDPNVAQPGQLAGKANLPAQLAGARGDFQVGFAGDANGDEGLANMTGLFTDEFSFTETFPTRIVVDERNITEVNTTMTNIYFNIQRARVSGDRAAAQYAQFDAQNPGHAEALSLSGYATVLMAEAYCSGVPFTTINADGSLTYGQPQTTHQLLAVAVAKFDSALTIATAAGDANTMSLASIGKARALLDEGLSNADSAAAAVASVPDNYRYIVFSSANTPREQNGLWELIWNEGRWSIADSEGINGLPFRSARDPRVQYTNIGAGFDQVDSVWAPNKYADRDSSTVLASGMEARLIEAEAALADGNPGLWLSKLNALRAEFPDTALSNHPLSDPGTPDGRVNLMFRERAFWLFATAHRLGDLRRLSRAAANGGYGRNPETVFPTGAYFEGGNYGNETSFPIPIEERNNPNFHGCLDTSP